MSIATDWATCWRIAVSICLGLIGVGALASVLTSIDTVLRHPANYGGWGRVVPFLAINAGMALGIVCGVAFVLYLTWTT